MKKLTLHLLLFCLAIKADAQILKQKLNQNWIFQEQDNAKWYPAKVPGEVYVDLLTNKIIPDPFYRDNEKKIQWIAKEIRLRILSARLNPTIAELGLYKSK